MDTSHSLLFGFTVCLTPTNLLYCALGVLLGTIVGVLPGIGPLGGITILLPTTFGMEPVSAIIMLAGIYYGAMYGGSTTSILVNIPGEAASVVTCFDGYQMARKGRAGPALTIAAVGSFIAGTFSMVGPDAARPAAGPPRAQVRAARAVRAHGLRARDRRLHGHGIGAEGADDDRGRARS